MPDWIRRHVKKEEAMTPPSNSLGEIIKRHEYDEASDCYSDMRVMCSIHAKAHDDRATLIAMVTEAVTLLKQGCGIIVEFGDLNGFRNLKDEELGALVVSTAQAIGTYLNKVSPVTDAERAAVKAARILASYGG